MNNNSIWPVSFKRYLLLLTGFFYFFSSLGAVHQDSTAGAFKISADFHYGLVMAHRPLLVILQKEHVTGFDIQISSQTFGNRDWQKIYLYPQLGLNYSFFNLGDVEHLGHGHALYPFVLFPVNSNPRVQLNVRFGAGIGYVDKIFNTHDNYKNQALATHFNAIFAIQMMLQIKLSPKTNFQTAWGITHFSNGSIGIPNLGANIVSLSGGLSYYFGEKKKIDRSAASIHFKRWRGSVMLAAGIKKIYPPGGARYLAGSMSWIESIRVKKKSAFGLALDVFYDNSIHPRLKIDSIAYTGFTDQLRVGVAGTYEIIVSDLSFLIQAGGYLHTKIKTDGSVYSRFGIRYAVLKNYFLCFNLKTHYAKADFFEWGGGIRF